MILYKVWDWPHAHKKDPSYTTAYSTCGMAQIYLIAVISLNTV